MVLICEYMHFKTFILEKILQPYKFPYNLTLFRAETCVHVPVIGHQSYNKLYNCVF